MVFTTAAGDLASLRTAEVDLEASRKATEEAKAAAAQAAAGKAPAKRKPVRVLTDKDFPRRAPAAVPEGAGQQPAAPGQQPAAGAAGEKPPAAGAAAEEEATPLQVTSWERAEASGDGHLAIKGALHNGSADDAAGAKLLVRIYDESGQVIATVQAALASTAIPAGGSTAFTADFPGVFAFAAVKFEGSSMRLRQTPEPPPPPPSPTGG